MALALAGVRLPAARASWLTSRSGIEEERRRSIDRFSLSKKMMKPTWIDFPRVDQHLPNGKVILGNDGSFDKCRRRFDLADAVYLRYRGMQEFDRAMQQLEEAYGFMISEHQYISQKDDGDKMIVFERGNLVFVFNFHWENSYSDYRVGCLKPGKYKVVLDSDDKLFGGFSRIDHTVKFFSTVRRI